MPRAILRDGVIYPMEPLPPEWADGRELRVEDAGPETPEDIERHFAELNALCAQGDPEDDKRVQEALDEAKALAKGLVRRSMGLP